MAASKKTITFITALAMTIALIGAFTMPQNVQASGVKTTLSISSATFYKSKHKLVVKYKIKTASVPKGYNVHIWVNDPSTVWGQDRSEKKKGTYTVTTKKIKKLSKKASVSVFVEKSSNNKCVDSTYTTKKITIKK